MKHRPPSAELPPTPSISSHHPLTLTTPCQERSFSEFIVKTYQFLHRNQAQCLMEVGHLFYSVTTNQLPASVLCTRWRQAPGLGSPMKVPLPVVGSCCACLSGWWMYNAKLDLSVVRNNKRHTYLVWRCVCVSWSPVKRLLSHLRVYRDHRAGCP